MRMGITCDDAMVWAQGMVMPLEAGRGRTILRDT